MPALCTLAIVGPTASGKSDVAMAVAMRTPGAEIVAVDAMQVYRGMDIGTAKPSPADRAAVPHHCVDVVDPSDEFSLTHYVHAGRTAIDDIRSRGGTPILVAGTGLYLRGMIDPMDVPGQFPEVREQLLARCAAGELSDVFAQLRALDPQAAARIEPSNERRVVRALEVCLGSGRAFSSFGPGLDQYPATDVVQIGLRWSRPLLAARIEQRVASMVSAGLVDEVAGLVSRSPSMSRTARQALGYKEIIDALDGHCTLDEAISTIVTRTRQYAVRQERWFRRDPRIRWVDIDDDPVRAVVPPIAELWAR